MSIAQLLEESLATTSGPVVEAKWLQKAIQHPGRVHKYLGVPEGEDIPVKKIDAALSKLKAKEDKSADEVSIERALVLAKRLQGGKHSFEWSDDEDGDELEEWTHIVEALNGKVSTFLTVFTSILTQYDKRLIASETKRGGMGNIYRLSLWFEALDRVRAAVQGSINDDSKEAVAKLRAALDKEFTRGMPGDQMRRSVDAYLNKGTLPKIPISKEVKAQMASERAAAKAAKAAGNKPSEMAQAAEALLDHPAILITEGDYSELAELGGGRYSGGSRGGDPRWMDAKFPGTAKDGTAFRKGDRVLYFPSSKTFYVGKQAEKEWKDFLSAKGDEEGIPYAEAQEVDPALAFPGEDIGTKPGAFKISSKALGLLKKELGPDWQPEQALFKRQRQVIDDLSNDDLAILFGADAMDKAQDAIAGNPRKAFNKWLMMAAKVSPKLGKMIRGTPENAALLFYLTVVRVSGRDMADIILKRYFETESDHIGAVKSRMKVEELEEAIAEARTATGIDEEEMESQLEEADNIVKTMRNRINYMKQGKGDLAWLRKAFLEEVTRMEQWSKLMRRLLGRSEGQDR